MMKVLIVKLSSIGDVVHTLPALDALDAGFKRKGIKARIDWLVEEAASGMLAGHPQIDEVIVVKRGWGKNLFANLRTAKALRERSYDLVLDFQGLLKSGIWVFLTAGKKRAGFSNAREFSRIFLNEKLPPYDIERHAVDRYLDLARHFSGGTGEARFTLDLAGAERSVEKKLKDSGVSGPFFVMVTRARWATKLWQDERFIELAKRVIAERKLKAVLTGGPSELSALAGMSKAIGDGAVTFGTSLKEFAALSVLSSFVVTVDSGPMHIAAAAGAKVVALFGPTAPWRTGPYGKGHVVVRKGLECSPCFKRDCPDPRCMDGITVDDVVKALQKI
ncbi:MAG TPA: glycosyltransferase family 9 protein [Thermodesulfobacteriota bacterium]